MFASAWAWGSLQHVVAQAAAMSRMASAVLDESGSIYLAQHEVGRERLSYWQPFACEATTCHCHYILPLPRPYLDSTRPAQVAIHTAPYKSSSFLQPPQTRMIVQRPPSSSRWEMIAGLQFMVVCRKSQSLSRVGLSLSNRPITTPPSAPSPP